MARALRATRPTHEVELVDRTALTVTARIGDVASGVAAYDRDWIGFRSIEVAPAHRRQGLGLAVMAALLEWGAEQGATTAYLQVLGDNAPALALYETARLRHAPRLPLPDPGNPVARAGSTGLGLCLAHVRPDNPPPGSRET